MLELLDQRRLKCVRPFNSLFEMPACVTCRKRRRDTAEAFNSLFEMPQSIANEPSYFTSPTFNSLFEMRKEVVASVDVPEQDDIFQFSI